MAAEGKAGAANAATPKTPCAMAVTLLAFCWNIAYTVYAAIPWSSLSDTQTVNGVTKECGDWLDVGDEAKKFMVLWKVTAVLYFINTFLVVCTCCLAVCGLV